LATKQQTFTISIRVDPTTYSVYKRLNDKEKKRLNKIIKMIILASVDEDFKDVLNINLNLELGEDTKNFIREVIKDNSKIEELARDAIAFIEFLLNVEESSPGSCDLISVNKLKALTLLERARRIL